MHPLRVSPKYQIAIPKEVRESMKIQPGRTLAMEAAALGCEMKLPLADSVIPETARALGAPVWTQDAHFASLPGVRYFPVC